MAMQGMIESLEEGSNLAEQDETLQNFMIPFVPVPKELTIPKVNNASSLNCTISFLKPLSLKWWRNWELFIHLWKWLTLLFIR
jgi:hypothetical protein